MTPEMLPQDSPPFFLCTDEKLRFGFTLVEMLVVLGVVGILLFGVVPAINTILGGEGVTAAASEISGLIELARAQAMANRSYVYVGFANATNSDGKAEIHCAAVISIDGSSDTSATNLRPLAKLLKLPKSLMTNYTNLPQVVKTYSDVSIQNDADYVINFPVTTYLQGQFGDTALNSCPTIGFSPQGEILQGATPTVFFRTIAAVGIIPTHGTTPVATNGAIVSYSGGSGQIRIIIPLL